MPYPVQQNLLSLLFGFCLLLVVVRAESTNCVKEFGKCVTTRDCCGRWDWGEKYVECVTGDSEGTTESICMSRRSQKLEALSKEHKFDHQTIAVLLKHHIFEHPTIADSGHAADFDHYFFEKIAKMHQHEFPKLVYGLERKYKITDRASLPKVINEFVKWKDTVDIAAIFAKGAAEANGEEF